MQKRGCSGTSRSEGRWRKGRKEDVSCVPSWMREGAIVERRDEGINSVVRISLRDMLSPFFSFAEAIISRGLPSPVEWWAARCMRAIRGEKKKREPRVCVLHFWRVVGHCLLCAYTYFVPVPPTISFFFIGPLYVRGIDVDSPVQ